MVRTENGPLALGQLVRQQPAELVVPVGTADADDERIARVCVL